MTTIPGKPIDEIKDAKVRRQITSICEEIRETQTQLNALETIKDGLRDDLADLTRRARIRAIKITGPGWNMLKSTTKRSSISKEKLLDAGVGMDVIEEATVTTESAPYWKVSKGKA